LTQMNFEIGDLVRFKSSGIIRSRYNPNKKIGIITGVKKKVFDSYDGKKEDLITVKWMPWDKEENMMSFYLEPVEKK
jgi:hypothetical protein